MSAAVGAVVLAAGAATRFGAPKQRLLLPRVLERLAEAPVVDAIVIVSGAHELSEVKGAQIVACADWDRGPGASLRCGLRSLPAGVEAAVVVLADGPGLSPEAVERVVRSWRAGAGGLIAASYEGQRGHPLVVDRALWESVPDEGLKALEPVLVDCSDLCAPGDVDRPEDLP